MSITIQYIIIALIFIIAVVSIVKKFIPSKNKTQVGCGKGCGCELDKSTS